jgi:plastocyanin
VRRRPVTFLLGSAVAVVAAAPAAAAEVSIGLDETNPNQPLWAPADVTIAAGDTVRWQLAGALPHNIHSTTIAGTGGWDYQADDPAQPAAFKFDTPGRYRFYCTIHSDGTNGMAGTVTVGNPPPPPPPPLSEQEFPNTGTVSPDAYEVGGIDTIDPRLRSVAAKRSGKRVRVSFRVNEQSVVTVRFQRGRKVVKTKRAATERRGSVTVRGLKAGRYRVSVVATDPAGNDSSRRRASFRVR